MEEAIVIGAGQAGLGMSWHLARRGVRHVVLERGRVGETWRTQRWDSFALNTPNWMNRLPGTGADPEPRDGFLTRDEWIAHLEAYATRSALPVRTGVEVGGVEPQPGGTFRVTVDGAAAETLEAQCVVVAAGIQRTPRVPALAATLPPDVLQVHTADYRNAAQLPPGAVLVVGSAQSGGQLAEDLLAAGRPVYLSASRVARIRRRTRGRDTLEWLAAAGFFDLRVERLPDPALRFAAQPLTSGVGRHGHTVSLQWLQARGATLVGRLRAVDGGRLAFDDDLGANIRFADERSAEVNRQVADGLRAAGLEDRLPPLEDDPADDPHPAPETVHSPEELDLEAAGIGTVIWATGFDGRIDWLPASMLDERGAPRHEGGSTPIPGLYVLGFPWLTCRKSGIILGIDDDARSIADRVADRLAAMLA